MVVQCRARDGGGGLAGARREMNRDNVPETSPVGVSGARNKDLETAVVANCGRGRRFAASRGRRRAHELVKSEAPALNFVQTATNGRRSQKWRLLLSSCTHQDAPRTSLVHSPHSPYFRRACRRHVAAASLTSTAPCPALGTPVAHAAARLSNNARIACTARILTLRIR